MQGDFRIDDWLIQPQINSVEKEGKTWHLEPKVMQVLVHLASHPNEVLSKDRLARGRLAQHLRWGRCARPLHLRDSIRFWGRSKVFPRDPDHPQGWISSHCIGHGGNTNEHRTGEVLTAKPEPVFRYDLELDHEKESQVAVVDEPHNQQTSWSPRSEDEQTVPTIVVGRPHRSPASGARQSSTTSNRHFWSIVVGASLVVLLGCLAAMYAWKSTHKSAFDFFWGPVFSTNEPVLICIADQNQYAAVALRDSADPTRQILLKDNLTAVIIDDLNAVIQITGILKSNERQYSLKGEGATTLTDLRNGPTVFVGAFDNAWTLRLTNPLRFHFANNPEMTQFRIVDREAPSQTNWGINRLEQMATNNYRDYAIVARFTDGNTGKLALVIAGVGRGGTIAAGELVTNPAYLAQLSNAASASGNKKNMEIVLSTQIIDGQPGSPKIEATYFW